MNGYVNSGSSLKKGQLIRHPLVTGELVMFAHKERSGFIYSLLFDPFNDLCPSLSLSCPLHKNSPWKRNVAVQAISYGVVEEV